MSDEPDKPDGKLLRYSVLRGAIVGVVAGILTGPIVLAWLLVDSILEPKMAMGTQTALGPLMVGIPATGLGFCLGPVAGALAGINDVEPDNIRGSVVFGVILMGAVGALMTAVMYFSNPPNFVHSTMMIIGMFLASPILAGMAGAPLVTRVTQGRNQRPRCNTTRPHYRFRRPNPPVE
jgi:hypothetical protein